MHGCHEHKHQHVHCTVLRMLAATYATAPIDIHLCAVCTVCHVFSVVSSGTFLSTRQSRSLHSANKRRYAGHCLLMTSLIASTCETKLPLQLQEPFQSPGSSQNHNGIEVKQENQSILGRTLCANPSFNFRATSRSELNPSLWKLTDVLLANFSS